MIYHLEAFGKELYVDVQKIVAVSGLKWFSHTMGNGHPSNNVTYYCYGFEIYCEGLGQPIRFEISHADKGAQCKEKVMEKVESLHTQLITHFSW